MAPGLVRGRLIWVRLNFCRKLGIYTAISPDVYTDGFPQRYTDVFSDDYTDAISQRLPVVAPILFNKFSLCSS